MKKTTKILGGVVAGAALAVAATLFLKSKPGKKLREDVSHKVADFYQYAAPKLKKLGAVTEAEYKSFMKTAVEEYAKAKKLSKEVASHLMNEAKNSWKEFSKHLDKK